MTTQHSSSRITDKSTSASSGFVGLALSLGTVIAMLFLWQLNSMLVILLGLPAVLLFLFGFTGLYTLEPNQAFVITRFGSYIGTDKETGFRWIGPLSKGRTVSLRDETFTTAILKINDKKGSPIEVATSIVFRVTDAAATAFNVDDYKTYVSTQTEISLRELVNHHDYAGLQSDSEKFSADFAASLQRKLSGIGIQILEGRLTHMAYAPEIAQAMLKVQQAQAMVDARRVVVEGAISMAQEAVQRVETDKIATFTDTQRTQLVSNLLIVLCSDKDVQPTLSVQTSH